MYSDDSRRSETNFFCFPPLKGNILVVGDGDFGFSVAFAKANRSHGTANIFASSLDTKEVVENKYSRGKDNLIHLASYLNVSVIHGLDATNPSRFGSGRVWDSIVWTFPYPPHTKCASNEEKRDLLVRFFQNMGRVLKFDGAIYIALKETRDLEGAANVSGLTVVRVMAFQHDKIDGYVPKRAHLDKKIPTSKTSFRAYKLCINAVHLPTKICSSNVCKLLKESGGELHLGTLKTRYEEKFGTLAKGGKFKKKVEKIYNGKFHLEIRNSNPWVVICSNNTTKQLCSSNVCKLLKESGGELSLSTLKTRYEEKFGTLAKGGKFKKKVEKISNGKFLLEIRNSNPWVMICSSNNATKQLCSSNVCKLLEESGGELNLGTLKTRYEEKFGILAKGGKFKKKVEKISNGKFHLKIQNSSPWVVLNSGDNTKICSSNVCKLLKEYGGELNLGTLKTRYEEKFGTLAKGGKFKEKLMKISNGKFYLEIRNSSPWVVNSGGTWRPSSHI